VVIVAAGDLSGVFFAGLIEYALLKALHWQYLHFDDGVLALLIDCAHIDKAFFHAFNGRCEIGVLDVDLLQAIGGGETEDGI